jgi:hypothetical protein
MITTKNFFLSTFALFKACKTPKRKADYVSRSSAYWGGGISSAYWYGSDNKGSYVIRKSNHWVKHRNDKLEITGADCNMIASCNWQIKKSKNSNYGNKETTLTGKCYLSKFKKLK